MEVLGRRVPRRLVTGGALPADTDVRRLDAGRVVRVLGDPATAGRTVAADTALQQELRDQRGRPVVHGVVVGQRAQQIGGGGEGGPG